ncbi:hypothetical protein [Acuticoccus mangrovi]|uniref:Uncharacterized protein n=1 Tax=Acuticoccus mangrovi TaxID=2796142 RepID=A0A934MHL1_9HYPH|nr:hypothetical protein [Acuticoccus mangrovi]MBJ3777778.1 hypothetical protein [Acuticoccus mangrovi]
MNDGRAALLLLPLLATPVAAQEVGVGDYACEADRAVAIRHEADGTPVTGAIAPVAPRFTLVVAPTDETDDPMMSCMAIAGFDSDAVQDFCRETDATIYRAVLKGRDEPSFNELFAWDRRIATGAPVYFQNGPASFLHLFAGRGFFKYTLSYGEPKILTDGFTFDYVTEQGRCRRAD